MYGIMKGRIPCCYWLAGGERLFVALFVAMDMGVNVDMDVDMRCGFL